MDKKVTAGTTLTLFLLCTFAISLGFTIAKTDSMVERWFDEHGSIEAVSLNEPCLLGFSELPVTEWNKTYGGTKDDRAESVQQTSDGGYIVAGYTDSFGAGGYDFWLVKTDGEGNMQWNKTYGGTSEDQAYSVVQTSDGGYAIAGYTNSSGAEYDDFWLVKTDGEGNMQWNKTYGGTSEDWAESVVQETVDGGYIVAGYTKSFGAGFYDFWLVKTDADGNMVWNQTYGGAGLDLAYSVQQTTDEGYIIAGQTSSFTEGSYDFWLVKTNSSGNQKWAKNYGGPQTDEAYFVQQTNEGGYIIAGPTNSFGAGPFDFWLVKTDVDGNMVWNQTYGGTSDDSALSVVQTSDGGYAILGMTQSFDAGSWDFWLVKTDVDGNMVWNQTYGGENGDFAYSVQQTSDTGYIMAGYTYSFGAGLSDVWLVKLGPPDTARPITLHDYDGLWHNTDFTITLTATDDASGVAETYYKINEGLTKSVSTDGQPRMTTEDANSKLEYWSIDEVGNEETHKILTEIRLDKTAPSGSITIKGDAPYSNSTLVSLTLFATDATSGVYRVRCSNYSVWDTEPWEAFSSTKAWTLVSGDGTKSVYYQIKDNSGLISSTYSDTIVLDTTPPSVSLRNPADAANLSTSTLNFNASAIDLESGIGKVELYLDGQLKGNMNLVSEGTYTLTISALVDGSHTWYASAYNGAGLATATSTRSFTVQTGQVSQERGPDYTLLYGLIVVALLGSLALAYYIARKKRARRAR